MSCCVLTLILDGLVVVVREDGLDLRRLEVERHLVE
jgi:hypothetical protein